MLGFVVMTVAMLLTGPGSGGRVALMIGVAALGTLAIPQTNAWLWPAVPFGSAWRDAHLRWAVLAAMRARRARHAVARTQRGAASSRLGASPASTRRKTVDGVVRWVKPAGG